MDKTVRKMEKMMVTYFFSFSHNFQKLILIDTQLTLSLLMMTQGAFVDSVDQDQTAQSMHSDRYCPHFHSRL